jgi:hypothetical protein
MNTEEAPVKTSGRHGRGHGDDERGVKPHRDRDLPRCSVEILRDLGLSKEKILAYHRRFPTPTVTTGRGPPPWAGRARERRQQGKFHSSPLADG